MMPRTAQCGGENGESWLTCVGRTVSRPRGIDILLAAPPAAPRRPPAPHHPPTRHYARKTLSRAPTDGNPPRFSVRNTGKNRTSLKKFSYQSALSDTRRKSKIGAIRQRNDGTGLTPVSISASVRTGGPRSIESRASPPRVGLPTSITRRIPLVKTHWSIPHVLHIYMFFESP